MPGHAGEIRSGIIPFVRKWLEAITLQFKQFPDAAAPDLTYPPGLVPAVANVTPRESFLFVHACQLAYGRSLFIEYATTHVYQQSIIKIGIPGLPFQPGLFRSVEIQFAQLCQSGLSHIGLADRFANITLA